MPAAVISISGANEAVPEISAVSGEDGEDAVFIVATLRFCRCKSTLSALVLCGFLSILTVMKHLLAITDPIRLTYIKSLLKSAGVIFVVQDRHISDLMAGSNTLFPMRVMVADDHMAQARRVLTDAGQYYDD
jgi:hypothetical protein